MRSISLVAFLVFVAALSGWSWKVKIDRVGDQVRGKTLIPTGNWVQSEGHSIYLPYLPNRILLLKDKSGVVVLQNEGISVYDLPELRLRQILPIPGGSSMAGLATSPDGNLLAVSNSHGTVQIAELRHENLTWAKHLVLPPPKVKGDAYPCGLAWTLDGKNLLVCGSRSNELLMYSTGDWTLKRTFEVGPGPFEIGIKGAGVAYVSCWGTKGKPGEAVANASGTPVAIDDRGIVKNGEIDQVNLESGEVAAFSCGRQPSNFATHDEQFVVPIANGDSLVSINRNGEMNSVDLAETFGKMCSPTWAEFGLDGRQLAVTMGRSNKLGIFEMGSGRPKLSRVMETNWYPSCVLACNQGWIVACAEGDGSRSGTGGADKRNVYDFHGSISLIPYQSGFTRLPRPRQEAKARPEEAPVPVPERTGEPSTIQHVVYILKENRTYDQVFGDMSQGEGSSALCDYPRKVTPNQHQLAEDFVLLDNYYCNGILSADGHAWAMEGNATSYFERTFGGWTRSYPYGDDPLSVSGTGFIWNDALEHGKSFQNYGEFDYATPSPNDGWLSIYKEFEAGRVKHQFIPNIGVDSLKSHTRIGYPGWNLGIPDVVRAGIFLEDLKRSGTLSDITIIYLPQDHTSGTAAGQPTPESCVADNDLAVGKVVEGISHSAAWPTTCIFVTEDDPQAGYDHVDGHRSTCLVISPFTYRNRVISRFYNQSSVLRTIELMLRIPPMNLLDAEATPMTACFTNFPDPKPYDCLPNLVPLDAMNKGADHSLKFDRPDENDEFAFNQVLWRSAHPGVSYPDSLGNGLGRRGLISDHRKSKDKD